MINLDTYLFSIVIALVVGAFGGYYLKDNVSKPDISTEIDVDLQVKKNKLFNDESKIKNLFKRGNKNKKKLPEQTD